MTPPTLRWALAGASDIAATRMIPAFRARGDRVIGVASGHLTYAQAYAQTQEIPLATDDLAALLRREDVDALYVSSTNDHHHDQVLAAAAAGKHVLCEKPLALSVADGQEMLEACARAGVVLAVNHHLPGAATHRAIQRLVADGAIGAPLGVRVAHAVLLPERLRGWRLGTGPGSGVVLDITCHDASVIQAILRSAALEACAIGLTQGGWGEAAAGGDVPAGGNLPAAGNVPDAVMTILRYGSGVLAQTHDAFTVSGAPTCVEVFGTAGWIRAVDVMTQDPIGEVWLRTADGAERQVDVGERAELYAVVLDAFAAATAGEGTPTVTGAQGLAATATALAAAESATTGRRTPVTGQPGGVPGWPVQR